MFNRSTQILTFAICILMFGSAQAGRLMKCWENKDGIRECGSSVPPEYSQSRIEILNERGLVVRVIEKAKTPEELRAELELKRQLKEEEARRKEQARLDNILLNTYTTERDLLLARDTNLKAQQGQIDILKSNLKLLQQTFDNYQEQAANFERTGKKAPQNIVNELEKTSGYIKDKKTAIKVHEQRLSEMEDKFKRDLKRFKELKNGRLN